MASRQALRMGKPLISKPIRATIQKIDPSNPTPIPLPYEAKPDQIKSPLKDGPRKGRLTAQQLNRRLLGIMVGGPIAIVSGYTLYLREAFGVQPRNFDGTPQEPTRKDDSQPRPKMF